MSATPQLTRLVLATTRMCRMIWDAIFGWTLDNSHLQNLKAHNGLRRSKSLRKMVWPNQPPRNTTFASHPYSGLCLAFDFPQISFPTSSSAARKYDFVFGNTTEIILEIQLRLSRGAASSLGIPWANSLTSNKNW